MAPAPFLGRAVTSPGGDQLQPVVVMRSVVERHVCTEPLFNHLPGGVVADRVGVGGWRAAQVAAEAGEPACLVVAVIDRLARRVSQSLDVAGQVVGLLSIVARRPTAALPEVLPILERSSERVVTIYRISRDIRADFLSAVFLRPRPVETPFPIHRPVEDSDEIALL